MKKKLLICSVLIVVLSVTATLAETKTEKWKFLSDEVYSPINLDGRNVLINHLEDIDFNQFYDSIAIGDKVDTIINDTVQTQLTTDNVLPDGRFLPEDSEEKLVTLIKERTKIKKLVNGNLSDSQEKVFSVKVETTLGESSCNLVSTVENGKEIISPVENNSFPFEFINSPDGSFSIIITDSGMWKVTGIKNGAMKFSKDYYGNKSFKEIMKDVYDESGTNNLFWNTQVSFSPDGKKIAYISNKDSSTKNRKQSLFIHDFATGKERRIKQGVNENYVVRGWINSEVILCEKWGDNKIDYCALDLKGNEVLLNIKGSNVVILGMDNNLVVYAPDYTSNEVVFAKFNENSLDVIKKLSLDGRLINLGQFSPDSSNFSFMYAPYSLEDSRNICIYDIKNDSVQIINDTPYSDREQAIRNFYYLSDNELLVIIGGIKNGYIDQSTWLYSY